MTVDRVAFGAVLGLALCLGLGDIAQVNSFDAVLLASVRGLLPLAIGLSLLATLLARRRPALPSRFARPALAWLAVLVASAALAPSNRLDAFASLVRPVSGALLAWAVYDLCRTRERWRLLAQAAALGGLAIALVGLAESTGVPAVRDWLASLHDGSVPIGDVPRISSTLSHPNEAAMVLELSLPLLVAWAWTAPRPWRVPLAFGALSNLVALVLTFSRAGMVAGMAGLAIMAGLCVGRGERRPMLSLSAAALAVPAALICAAMANQGLDRRLTAELTQPPIIHHAPLTSEPAVLSAETRAATAQSAVLRPPPPGDGTQAAAPGAKASAGTMPSVVLTPLSSAGGTQAAAPGAQASAVTMPSVVLTPLSSAGGTQAAAPGAQASAGTGQSAAPGTQAAAASGQPAVETTSRTPLVAPQPSRMAFWAAAVEMVRDYPWLGVGPDNFRWRFASYSGVPGDNLGIHAHDQYLEALADTGVLGLLTLGWLLLSLLRTAVHGVKRRRSAADWPWRAAILASLSAWLLHALLDDFERFWPASVAFWLLAGLNLRLPVETRASGSANQRQPRPPKRAAAAALAACVLLVTGAACAQRPSPASAYPTINGIACDTSEKVAFHIHAHLAIFADGQPVTVPYGIGIGKPWSVQGSPEGPFVVSGSCFYWLHTHTEDGIIHIESPVERTFTLGDFFAIWGQPLTTTQAASAQGSVIAYVNNVRSTDDPNQIPLQAHELIQLDVGQDVPPQPFTFPAGL